MRFKSILIVTYGRSGSTLLQGVLNSIEGVIIRGENYNFIYHLFQAFNSLKETLIHIHKHIYIQNPTDPFFGAHLINLKTFMIDAWNLVKNQLYPDVEIDKIESLGYKEIRYENLDKNILFNYLNFQYELFPKKVCFIFLFRDLDEVVKSGWWKTYNPDDVKKRLTLFEQNALEYYEKNKENSFVIRYENIVNIDSKLKELYDFLGANFSKEKIEKVLSIPHSYDHRSIKIEWKK